MDENYGGYACNMCTAASVSWLAPRPPFHWYASSRQRMQQVLRAGAQWFPWRRGFFTKAAFDVVVAGAGVQPGLAVSVGYAYWFKFPLGLVAELEVSGRLTRPRVLEINAVAGIFTHF